MTVSAGTACYALGMAPCTGAGRSWTAADLDAAIAQRVAGLVFDDDGKADVAALLASVAETQFDKEAVSRILADADDVEDWRVGEAIAEAYLTDHHSASFPWPDGRDERKIGSSLPGADLVGFCSDKTGECFAFGEVKTSGEDQYPPQAMYGRTGLKQQLEDLRDREDIRHTLVKYLAHRAGNAAWKERYRSASRRYLADNTDVRVFGILVRDVVPNQDDLRVRVSRLGENCPKGTVVHLLALYLPPKSIDSLGDKVLAARKAGGA
jgi:hypothetical protein